MNESTFPIESIRHDLARFSTEARQLKTILRTRWQRTMADEQRRLAVLRLRVTELCVTRAHARGRLHQRTRPAGAPSTWTAEAHAAAVAARVLSRYAVQPAAPTASTPSTGSTAAETAENAR